MKYSANPCSDFPESSFCLMDHGHEWTTDNLSIPLPLLSIPLNLLSIPLPLLSIPLPLLSIPLPLLSIPLPLLNSIYPITVFSLVSPFPLTRLRDAVIRL